MLNPQFCSSTLHKNGCPVTRLGPELNWVLVLFCIVVNLGFPAIILWRGWSNASTLVHRVLRD
jgi:hypothetical protein